MTLEEHQKLYDKGANIMALGDGKAATVEGVQSQSITLPVNTGAASTAGLVVEEEPTVSEAPTGSAPTAPTAPTVAPQIVAALLKRLQFWQDKKKEAEAVNEDALKESADEAIGRIQKEAQALGVDLNAPVAAISKPATAGGKGGKKSKQPRSVVEKEALGNITARKLAEQAASKPAGEAKAKAPTVKKEKVMRPCLDGCGAMVPGNFQMGHDAKLKSLLLKIERGEVGMENVPEIVSGIVKFKKGIVEELKDAKGVTTGKVQTYHLLAAPVKFHGRPEVQITQREQ